MSCRVLSCRVDGFLGITLGLREILECKDSRWNKETHGSGKKTVFLPSEPIYVTFNVCEYNTNFCHLQYYYYTQNWLLIFAYRVFMRFKKFACWVRPSCKSRQLRRWKGEERLDHPLQYNYYNCSIRNMDNDDNNCTIAESAVTPSSWNSWLLVDCFHSSMQL